MTKTTDANCHDLAKRQLREARELAQSVATRPPGQRRALSFDAACAAAAARMRATRPGGAPGAIRGR